MAAWSGDGNPFSSSQVRCHVGLVLGVSSGIPLGMNRPTVEIHLEHATPGGNERDLVGKSELVEDGLGHAHGTAGVVSRTAEFDRDPRHGNQGRDPPRVI
jgi:hypothetical protein